MSMQPKIEPFAADEKSKTVYTEDVESTKSDNEQKVVNGSPDVGGGMDAFEHQRAASEAERALVWKQDLRIVPLCAAIYLLCFLDRSSIGNAKVLNLNTGNDLLTETHMSNLQYTVSLMVFLVAYAVFEVPSNYMLKRLRPSRWISFIMISWGALTMGLGGTNSFGAVTALRFLLGAFEAGLFPGIVYYLTFWYKRDERSVRVALTLIASATVGGAFGGAIAYGVGHMNQAAGLSAWRWLFILEGLPSILAGVATWFILPDYPETASWLSASEKSLASDRLRTESPHEHDPHMTWADAKATLTDWRLYAHYAVFFGNSCSFSSLSYFTPTITAGLGYEGLSAQLFTIPPYAVAFVVTLLSAWAADHFNARGLTTAVFATIGAAGFATSAALPPAAYAQRYGCLIVASSGSFACSAPLLGWLSSNLFSTAAVGLAIAMNVSFGAPGQIVGVWVYKSSEATKGYPTGHWTNAGLLFFVAIVCLGLTLYYRTLNRKIRRDGGVKLYKY